MKRHVVHEFLVVLLLLVVAHESDCVKLTNMTAPPVHDPRLEMSLHCQFDMEGLELYAVKWYKDDQEFFRYMPRGDSKMTFPVTGVDVDKLEAECDKESCDLILTNLHKPQSSGAYRCEVSSESPQFLLASETHLVTMAVLPEKSPTIELSKSGYRSNETMLAKCKSAPGDPKPALEMFFNGHKVPVEEKYPSVMNNVDPRINLQIAMVEMRVKLEKLPGLKVGGENLLQCISTVKEFDHRTAPPLASKKVVHVFDPNQPDKKQQLWGYFTTSGSRSVRYSFGLLMVLVALITFNYNRSQ